MSGTEMVMERALRLAESHGHAIEKLVGSVRSNRYSGTCPQCGARLHINVRPGAECISGSAGITRCRQRQIRFVPTTRKPAQERLAPYMAEAAADPLFLGYALAWFAYRHHLEDAPLAAYLGVNQATLARLCLCRRPDFGSATFGAECQRIAELTGCRLSALTHVLQEIGC